MLSHFHHPFINQILDNFETDTHISFFTIFAKNCENRLHPGKEQALCTRFTLSLQQKTIKRMKSVKRGLQDTIMR